MGTITPREKRSVPFDVGDKLTVKAAAFELNCSPDTAIRLARHYGVGWQAVPGGAWSISGPAFRMVAAADMAALAAFCDRKFDDPRVMPYLSVRREVA